MREITNCVAFKNGLRLSLGLKNSMVRDIVARVTTMDEAEGRWWPKLRMKIYKRER